MESVYVVKLEDLYLDGSLNLKYYEVGKGSFFLF